MAQFAIIAFSNHDTMRFLVARKYPTSSPISDALGKRGSQNTKISMKIAIKNHQIIILKHILQTRNRTYFRQEQEAMKTTITYANGHSNNWSAPVSLYFSTNLRFTIKGEAARRRWEMYLMSPNSLKRKELKREEWKIDQSNERSQWDINDSRIAKPLVE